MKKQLLLKPELTMLQFETNTCCQAQCVFCEHRNMKRRGFMPTSKIIDLIYHYGRHVDTVHPFGMQEPLLEPRLSMILANIKQMNPETETIIYTNMGVYPEKQLREIVEWGTLDQVEVSFYGATPETYSYLQPPLNYEQTTSNILKLMELKRELGRTKPTVEVMMLHLADTLPYMRTFLDQWKGKVDKVSGVHYDGWCGKQPYSYETETKLWGYPGQQVRTPCPRLWNSMYVHYDGTLVPCCLDAHDEEPLGNVFESHNLFYDSPRLNELRSLHEQRKFSEIPLCKECVTWRYGCEVEWNKFWMNAPLP